jgi:hypothetical protein
MFDQVVNAPHAGSPPALYHYTTWTAIQGILASQRFWATAHDCTNDGAELVSADAVIIETATDLLKNAMGVAAKVLRLFVEGYANLHVTKVITVCLTCFSIARDNEQQWRKYGDDGRGVCLGIRVLDEPSPKGYSSALVKVDYSEQSWRASLAQNFGAVCSLLSGVAASGKNLRLGLAALHRIAAFASIGAKRAEWAVEQEFRQVTVIPQNSDLRIEEREAGGKVIRYLPVPVRAVGKRIAFSEIIIGSSRNFEESCDQLKNFLATQGYRAGDIEYPQFTPSAIPSRDTSLL